MRSFHTIFQLENKKEKLTKSDYCATFESVQYNTGPPAGAFPQGTARAKHCAFFIGVGHIQRTRCLLICGLVTTSRSIGSTYSIISGCPSTKFSKGSQKSQGDVNFCVTVSQLLLWFSWCQYHLFFHYTPHRKLSVPL